jgi:excisionase family DNA binding protein
MRPADSEKGYLTLAQAARICCVNRVTMWRWVKAGTIHSSVTAGGHHRVRKADLAQFIKTHRMEARRENNSQKPRILIVDDEPPIRKYLSRILDDHGYETQVCADGFEAGVRVMRFRPHLVLLDLYMPGADGFRTCKMIKGDMETAHIKVIAISGDITSDAMARILGCGADDVLRKPIDKKTVIRAAASLLEDS